jgi:hypothetical protein
MNRSRHSIITSWEVLESNARRGISGPPISKWKGLLLFVHQTWTRSIVRQVANEIRNFCRRMAAILGNASLRHGALPVSPYQEDCILGDLLARYTYQDACNMGIQRLRNQIQWFGLLEAQISARSFLLGATWAAHSVCNEKHNQSVGPVASWLNSNKSGNSMPPQASQQLTKHDL